MGRITKERLSSRFGRAGGLRSRKVKHVFNEQNTIYHKAVRRHFIFKNIFSGETSSTYCKYYISELHDLKMKLVRDNIPGAPMNIIPRLDVTKTASNHMSKNKPTPSEEPKIPDIKPLDGYRLFNLSMLPSSISILTKHVEHCPKRTNILINQPPIELIGESKNCGLASSLVAKGFRCGKIFQLKSSSIIKTLESPHYDINVRGVWRQMAVGGGPSPFNECLSTMGVPGISPTTFSTIESHISGLWQNSMESDLVAAGEEEKALAVQRGDFHEGVPAITVIADAGWSKRSHKHTYNALGGVAVIIGAATKKVLYVDVNNRYCIICFKAFSKGEQAKPLICLKNWQESTHALEANAILEGFNKCGKMHGVRYMRLIGDGDSSVMSTLQREGPHWAKSVQKLECANHCCKCLRGNLEKLVEEKPSYKGKNKLTKATQVKLTTAVRCAIKMRSGSSVKAKAAELLRIDIINSVDHVFGYHHNCDAYFCKTKQGHPALSCPSSRTEMDSEGHSSTTTDISADDSITDTLVNQAAYWSDGASVAEMEASRISSSEPIPVEKEMIQDIKGILNRLANKSSSLIGNVTSNLAENWMSIRLKCDSGKRVNRCSRGSWHSRCYGAFLRSSRGAKWSPGVWKEQTRSKPSAAFIRFYNRYAHHQQCAKISRNKPEVKSCSVKRKHESRKVATSIKARKSYGPEAEKIEEDLHKEELEEKCRDFYRSLVETSSVKAKEIEEKTRDQSFCIDDAWQK